MDLKKLFDLSTDKVRKSDQKKNSENIIGKDEVFLLKISKIIVSNLNSDKICQDAADIFVNHANYPGVILFLANKEGKTVDAYTFSSNAVNRFISEHLPMDFRDFKYSFDLAENLTVKTFLTKKEFEDDEGLINFIKPLCPPRLTRWINRLSGTKIARSFPVIFSDEVIAVLVVAKRETFSEKEKETIRIFSVMLGVAINNSKLYEKINNQVVGLQEKTQDLASLLDISAIAASSLETSNITQKIVDSVPEKLGHLGYIGGFLAMYDPITTELRGYSITESALIQKKVKELLDRPLGSYSIFVNRDNNLSTEAIKTGEIQIAEDAYKFVCPPVSKNIVITMQKLIGLKACAVLPIFIQGEAIGTFMFMIKKSPKEIGERDIALMKAFVNHISISIDNAMLFDRTTKQIAELERTKSNLEEILTMKNDFLHIVSHQLRTPLTAVRGLISMWRDGDFDHYTADKMKAVKDRVSSNADRLNNIINDMIVAMESEGELKLVFGPTDIEKLIKENIEILKANYEKKGLYVKYSRVGENIPEIEADPKYLIHVFMNIIDNAEKYTERGGLEITLQRQANNIYIRFTDTGVGISEEDQKNLFQKFSRGKKSNLVNPNGSGLGLFIAKQILDEHHGDIQASSLGEGKGATVVVSLPLKQPVMPSVVGQLQEKKPKRNTGKN